MSNLVDKIIRQALGRESTAEDYRKVHEMLSALPDEMRSSPGVICDIVLRMEFIRKLEATIQQAGWEAQQRIHADLPHRIDDAAYKALNKIRTMMPASAAGAVRGMLMTALVLLTILSLVSSMSGWVLGQNHLQKALVERQRSGQVDVARCVDASIGQVATATSTDSKLLSEHLQSVRSGLLACVEQQTNLLAAVP